jgi:hypothetical protein
MALKVAKDSKFSAPTDYNACRFSLPSRSPKKICELPISVLLIKNIRVINFTDVIQVLIIAPKS